MKNQTQYNLLSALSLLIFAALAFYGANDTQAMAALTMAGTLAGRGKSNG